VGNPLLAFFHFLNSSDGILDFHLLLDFDSSLLKEVFGSLEESLVSLTAEKVVEEDRKFLIKKTEAGPDRVKWVVASKDSPIKRSNGDQEVVVAVKEMVVDEKYTEK
jgi:hypothetical protein